VWDVMSNEEAVSFVAQDTGDRATVAERLKERVLEMEAAAQEVTVAHLKGLPPGSPGRRQWHDDITVVVVYLGGAVSGDVKQKSWLW
jgi:hypothetical protein